MGRLWSKYPRRSLAILSSVFILGLGTSATSLADDKIYTWTDGNGVTHYGDRPPSEADAKEVQVRAGKGQVVNVDAGDLVGKWRLTSSEGITYDWIFTDDNKFQSEFAQGADRTIVQGDWDLTQEILTVDTFVIQETKSGKTTTDDTPIQLIYKFVGFDAENFRILNNGITLVGKKK